MEAVKIIAKLGEGVPKGGTKLEDCRFLREGKAKREKGDGAIHLVEFVHGAYQGAAVAIHMVQAHCFGIGNNQIKVQ